MSCNRPSGPFSSSTNAGFYAFAANPNTGTDPSTDIKVTWEWYPDAQTHVVTTPGSATPDTCHIDYVKIYRDGVEVGSIAVNRNDTHTGNANLSDIGEFNDTGLSPGTTYSYTVTAYISDSSPNPLESLHTSAVTATTATTSNQQGNNAPVANNSTETVVQNGSLTATASATDADGDALTYGVTTSPTNGSVTLDSSTGVYTYVPTANYIGADTFVFTVTDGVDSASATVTITVSRAVPNAWYISVTDAVTSPWTEGKLVWTETVSNSTDVGGFKLYQSGDGGANWTEITDIAVGEGSAPTSQQTEYVATGLTPSTSYQYYVIAYNTGGNSANSNTAHYTTVATPNGMQTADVDEQGETGVITVTGIFYNGWGWTTTNPGAETDVTQWPSVNMVTNNSLSATGAFAAGAHEIWVAAVGWTSSTHHIQFDTYSGISASVTPTAVVQQDNQTLSVSVPHDGTHDWTSLHYAIDYYAWTGTPGSAIAGFMWTQATVDAQGNFTVDLGGTVAPTLPAGQHDLVLLGTYSENGAFEQAGASPTSVQFTRWNGIQDVQVPTVLDDGTENNVSLVLYGLSPDTPHGWRYSLTEPPLDANGNQLTDISGWGSFVEGKVEPGGTNASITIRKAGTYSIWAQACWSDGTPLLRMTQAANAQWLSYTPISVPQHAYAGLTDVTLSRDGEEIVITVEGGFYEWRYSVGKLFSGSAPGHDVTGEGTLVQSGNVARYTPTSSGRQIIYIAAVDPNQCLVSASTGAQPVLTRIIGYDLENWLPPRVQTYDPAAVTVPRGTFVNHPTNELTSALLSTELGFATEATIDAFVPVYGLQPLVDLMADKDAMQTAGFDAMVTDQFTTYDASIVANTSYTGADEVTAALGTPMSLYLFRVDMLRATGVITHTQYMGYTTGNQLDTVVSIDEATGAVTNITQTVTTLVPEDENPSVYGGGVVTIGVESDADRSAEVVYDKTTEQLYDMGYYYKDVDVSTGTFRPYGEVFRAASPPRPPARLFSDPRDIPRITAAAADDPYVVGGIPTSQYLGTTTSDESHDTSNTIADDVVGPLASRSYTFYNPFSGFDILDLMSIADEQDLVLLVLDGGLQPTSSGDVLDPDPILLKLAYQEAWDAEYAQILNYEALRACSDPRFST